MRKLDEPRRLERMKNVEVNEAITEPWYFTHY